MASLESLPPDQKAVLSLVLQRGRGYDEIAALLAIDRAAVRDRALRGFDQLGPSTTVAAPQRALITDYILGQLPTAVAAQVRTRLASNAPERAWARVIAAEVGPIATHPLPEIPAAGSAGSAAPARRAAPARQAPPAATPTPADSPAPAATPVTPTPAAAAETAAAAVTPASTRDPAGRGARGGRRSPGPSGPDTPQASSKRGGAILLGLLAIVIIAVVVVLIATSGSSKKNNATHNANSAQATNSNSSATTPSTGTGTSTAASGTGTTPKVLKQLPLVSATGAKTPSGAADVAEESGVIGLVILADGLPANTKNAYAVWLFNSKTQKSTLLGFDPSKVAATGKAKGVMEVETPLPTNAASAYNELLITSETNEKPTKPGTIVLQGDFSE